MKKARLSKLILVNALVFAVFLLLLEATAQVIALTRPSYDVLMWQPHRVLGWKLVPNFQFTWAGHYWYAADFRVEVKTNALGFRDAARGLPKQHGGARVALLGDSFIEAVQVPFERTAGQLLEHRLNTSSERNLRRSGMWEVLNFGTSNYGVGQYLLMWEEYTRKYDPDYVAVFVAKFIMERTVSRYEYGAFSRTMQNRLWIRPTFQVDSTSNSLVREPAKDYNEFVKVQEDLMRDEFAGQRVRRKRRVITARAASLLLDRIRGLVQGSGRPHEQITPPSSQESNIDSKALAVNAAIIEELGRQTHNAGSQLIVLDASQYFGDDETVSSVLEELCIKNRLGYIPLYEYLSEANQKGISTHWAHDVHFNEAGNVVLAEALYQWILQDSRANTSE